MKKLFILCAVVVMMASTAMAQSTFVSQLPVKAKKGMTVMGVVESQGKPVAGVAVSDGYEVTVTDKAGRYWLPSAKKNGNVFITIPSGYEAQVGEDAVPQYWAHLTAPATEAERHDFLLTPVDNKNHVILAITDLHISNMLNDVEQFTKTSMPRIREEVEKYRSQGIPVYTMCMGDSSFDLFWYDYLFTIADFRTLLGKIAYPTQMFHVTGNHDHDGATPAGENCDFESAALYRKTFGPSYYSFNIGDVHYIMLDNIYYKNEEGKKKYGKNIVGRRNYDHSISQEQLDWLKKDLALVEDKNTPIVIGMHCPVYRYGQKKSKSITDTIETLFVTKAEVNKFQECLKEFSEVHFLTGHTHKNVTTHGNAHISNVIDHNIGALCGAWWYTGAHGGPNMGPDTAPAGFEVFDVKGRDLSWYYTSTDHGAGQQFTAYDINTVRDYWREAPEARVFSNTYEGHSDFASAEDNLVYINVWAWEPTWRIHVREVETGKVLDANKERVTNPQFTLAYLIPKTVWDRNLRHAKYGKEGWSNHTFVVEASAPETTLEITVTDGFGRVYKQTMVRPKAFSIDMK